jgi:DNA-binding GntR family transcriptional regulator
MNEPYRSLEHTDLSEETYRQLKERILRRQFTPGDKIAINEVAQGLGVSRTPVIAALQRLAADGLVEVVARRGTFVHCITPTEVEDIFEVRRMIELYAAQLILEKRLVPQFRAASGQACAVMEQAAVGDAYLDYHNFIRGDHDFHFLLVSLTENRRIIDIYRGLNVHTQVARAQYIDTVEDARQTQREHASLLEAFDQGHLDQVRQALNQHINNVKHRIIQVIHDQGGQI